MDSLLTTVLLDVWEQGREKSSVQRALLLLTVGNDSASNEALVNLSIGQRDARLLTLREQLFGSQLISMVLCPKCTEQLELNFSVDDIRIESEVPDEDIIGTVNSVEVDGYQIQFRLPNSADLLALSSVEVELVQRQVLLERCLLSVKQTGTTKAIDVLPSSSINFIIEQMARLDPQAEVSVDLSCPACQHMWLATFDIVSFLWSELDAWALRTLNEVHLLASTYSWREADILALTPWRRQFYLQKILG